MQSIKRISIISVVLFSVLSLFVFVQHEIYMMKNDAKIDNAKIKPIDSNRKIDTSSSNNNNNSNSNKKKIETLSPKALWEAEKKEVEEKNSEEAVKSDSKEDDVILLAEDKEQPKKEQVVLIHKSKSAHPNALHPNDEKGLLFCNNKRVDSEVIYWKIVPGDAVYESPITPHHGEHHDKYLSFEYDHGGWNNVRMGVECLIVAAHAMGRTLVVPPQQHLYLLGKNHKDKGDEKAHDEMGFEDFYDIDLLRTHKGFHVMHMEEFLANEGVTGGLHGMLPPRNSTEAWGSALWSYLEKVADLNPEWAHKVIAFPDHPGNFTIAEGTHTEEAIMRMKEFTGERPLVFYDEIMQNAHHIHFPGDDNHRILQHHYAFTFFASKEMQSFYKRFVRDYMRYKDVIQCYGHELVTAIREDAKKTIPESNGDYYALHIRRGDFQFKDVKISAKDIYRNLHYPNGSSVIPRNSLVYISTDDPSGICKDCYVNRISCDEYKSPKPVGCPEDTSWDAFKKAGWTLRFFHDYHNNGVVKDSNPNTHGMIESIVCSRAKIFAGTYFSTFTGYIHRLRGYHGLGESTYYHSNGRVFSTVSGTSMGHGFSREWRYGWVEEDGEPI